MASDEKPAKSTGRPLGPTGETVRSNIKRIRENQRIAVTELSAKMRDLGRPIPTLGIHRIEDGQRRVDVDDLVALAVALGVSPPSLLMPNAETSEETVTVTGHREPLSAERAWSWFGGHPISGYKSPTALASFMTHAWPRWHWRRMRPLVEKALAPLDAYTDESGNPVFAPVADFFPDDSTGAGQEDSDGDD
jgi:transcriptional regulator with XRE-family HTH domain